MSNRRLGLLLAVLAGVATWYFWPAEKPSDEQQIRLLVARVCAGAEHRNVGEVLEPLADDFHGPSGLSRTELQQLVMGQFFRDRGAIVVLNPSLDVHVTGAAATLQGTFLLTQAGGDQGGTRRLELEATLEKRGDRWLFTTASWRY
jgi:hypothetical protein